MSAYEMNLRQRAILKRLQISPASYKEIQEYFALQEEITEAQLQVSSRTFRRDLDALADNQGIEVEYDPKLRKYRIAQRYEPEFDDRYFETLDILSIMSKDLEAAAYLFFDHRRSTGTEHMKAIMKAIIDRKKLSFQYKKHWEDKITQRLVEPLALKQAMGRWYLLALQDEKLKTFGLDRMHEVRKTTIAYQYPTDIYVSELFNQSFGIISPPDMPAERIRFRTTVPQGKYLCTYPLHQSQQLLEQQADHYLFELEVKPTFDLEMEFLSQGETLEVLEPQHFRERIHYRLKESLAQYDSSASSA